MLNEVSIIDKILLVILGIGIWIAAAMIRRKKIKSLSDKLWQTVLVRKNDKL